ncbi:MAG TPA: alpha-amylase family glycosyl hydrolase [Tepidisphaeraceae bacterium]|jgi:glycosidase|nr:alpha-amylase family glycosyl hydrolase [Tepidisphaeraceae bacterium]
MSVTVKPVIYQLVVRYFGNTNTTNRIDGTLAVNGCGKFEDINEAALTSLRQMGVTHIWLTGCLRQATLTDWSLIGLPPDDPDVVKGIAGSFYAVRDYFDVCPDYAREPANRLAEFDALVQRVHAAGMKAIIDLVPNHVARGYRSVVRPEHSFGEGDDVTRFFDPTNHFFYLVDPPGQELRLRHPAQWQPAGVKFDGMFASEAPPRVTGNNCTLPSPAETDWYETIKLNYGYDFVGKAGHYSPRPRTWDAVDEIIAYWQKRGVDGFRCDFAHYVPEEAWRFLIDRARGRDADSYFIAEAYPYPDSGDPITDMQQLVDAGFDAVYHDDSYNRLKRIYQRAGSQDDYGGAIASMSTMRRQRSVFYLENHDERRIGSPVVQNVWTGNSGFGSVQAGYLLAPLQYLCGAGPIIVLNGQEVGELGQGASGFSGDDGRTSLFDYWSMPAMVGWVNRHAYDGGRLTPEQQRLRAFYRDLLVLCQDPSVQAEGYWGLKYFNRPEKFSDCPGDIYSFARFADGEGRLLMVVGNFHGSRAVTGRVRVPGELAELVKLAGQATIRMRLDHQGAKDRLAFSCTRDSLIGEGFEVTLLPQTAQVFVIR